MIITGTLIVNYGKIRDVTRTAQSLSNKISRRIDDYSGIKKNIAGVGTTRNNLSQSNYFIEKKIQKLRDKSEQIGYFKAAIADFGEEAKEADKRVARRITDDTKTFKQANSIRISVFAYIGVGLEDLAKGWFGRDIVNLIEAAGRRAKYDIKDWYHDKGGKYTVNIVKDAVKVAVAIAAFAALIGTGAGLAAFFFAGFSIYSASAKFGYDVAAKHEFNTSGNRVIADRIDDSDGSELTMLICGKSAEGIALMFNQDSDEYRKNGEAIGAYLFGGLEIAQAFYNITKLKNFIFGKDFKFKALLDDIKYNSNNAKLTELISKNVTDSSLIKTFRDYGYYKNSTFITDKTPIDLSRFAIANNYATKDWKSMKGIYKNIRDLKKFFTGGVMGKYTYKFPFDFKDKIDGAVTDIKDAYKDVKINKTVITPLKLSV
mgnify:CR=1 FL=1